MLRLSCLGHSAKATKAAIACRYRDNADSTITDYDTGLMWDKKTAGEGERCGAETQEGSGTPDG